MSRTYPFPLDRFQTAALAALDAGRHVVVAAPTGSGKTVVAEHGIDGALASGRRAFYTAPIKALSNQKYRDLVVLHGEERVGLLTGDTAIRPDADVVVMTTEVLRNMVYGRRRGLADLDLVVLDEVHFLQDAYRGPVWEEVIIHLPHHVRLVCLSATVSNASELAEWITTVRGPTEAVVEERRPVRLEPWYLVGDRSSGELQMLPVLRGGRPNRAAAQLDASGAPSARRDGRDGRSRGRGRPQRLYPPGRIETVRLLRSRDMLPAIVFVFSRNQCDDAARSVADAGLRLTTGDERRRIREIVTDRLEGMHPTDLAVLGHRRFVDQLTAGVAAHHAGLIPPFKEVVETCFAEGLTKVVFATETLAVGVNMPARTVVIEKLSKFTGERHEILTPGQFTQLTGRAGRRGIDEIGHAVVLWSPFVRFDRVAELVASRSFHLRSAFRPTYNMAANLVRTTTDEEAHRLLSLSFAQFQSDRDVVRLEARIERERARLAEAVELAGGELAGRDGVEATERSDETTRAIDAALAELRPGDVVTLAVGGYRGPAAVVATAQRTSGARATVVTPAGHRHRVRARDLRARPGHIGAIELPVGTIPDRPEDLAAVAARLRTAGFADGGAGDGTGDGTDAADASDAQSSSRERREAAERAERLRRRIEDLTRRVEGREQTLARQFDAVLAVLDERGFVDRGSWRLTNDGEILARIFHECDLLVAESVRGGLLDGLDAPELAGVVSAFVYEHRSPDDPLPPWYPSRRVARAVERIGETSADLAAREARAELAVHRAPDPTFLPIAHAWVAGDGFAALLDDEELTGGDVVRTLRQLIDLLRQIAQVAPERRTREVAAEAAALAFRDVVADSAALT